MVEAGEVMVPSSFEEALVSEVVDSGAEGGSVMRSSSLRGVMGGGGGRGEEYGGGFCNLVQFKSFI